MGKWPLRFTRRAVRRDSLQAASAKGSSDFDRASVVLKRSCSLSRSSSSSETCIRLGCRSSQSKTMSAMTTPQKLRMALERRMLRASRRSAKTISTTTPPAAVSTRPAYLKSRLMLHRIQTLRMFFSNGSSMRKALLARPCYTFSTIKALSVFVIYNLSLRL